MKNYTVFSDARNAVINDSSSAYGVALYIRVSINRHVKEHYALYPKE
jgi:hypothetical protein